MSGSRGRVGGVAARAWHVPVAVGNTFARIGDADRRSAGGAAVLHAPNASGDTLTLARIRDADRRRARRRGDGEMDGDGSVRGGARRWRSLSNVSMEEGRALKNVVQYATLETEGVPIR